MASPQPNGPNLLPFPPADLDLASARLLDVDQAGRLGSRRWYALRYGESHLVQLSESALWLLTVARDRLPLPQAAAQLADREGIMPNAADLRRYYGRVLAQLAAIGPAAAARDRSLTGQRRFMHARTAQAVASRLTYLFAWPAVAVVLALSAGGFSLAWYRGLRMTDHYGLAVSYGLLLLAGVSHELGHAGAMFHNGGRTGDIWVGVGPAGLRLSTDVTDVWRLRRERRIAVNVGGVYLQTTATAGYAAFYCVTGWRPLATAMVLSIGAVVTSLLPLGQSDGSWVVADLLGLDRPKLPGASLRKRIPARPTARVAYVAYAMTPWLVLTVLGAYLVAGAPYRLSELPIYLGRLVSGQGSNAALVAYLTMVAAVPGLLSGLLRPLIRAAVTTRRQTEVMRI